MKITNNNKGFTLIELIMVIVILGILAAVVVPKFFDFTGKAHIANKEAVIGSIRAGLNLYAANELIDEGARKFPKGGTLTFSTILDESPDSWSLVNNAGADVDTIKYSGDGSKWTYETENNEKTYTIATTT